MLPRPLRAPFTADLRAFADADDHAGGGGVYVVRSLYLDSADWTCFHDKVDGLPQRDKLRIRAYLRDGVLPEAVKFEIKHREGERIRKEVATVGRDEYRRLLPGLRTARLSHLERNGASQTLGAFFRRKHLMALVPAANVQFRRQAFVVRGQREYRVTLDDSLIGWRASDVFDRAEPPACAIDHWNVILEIKTGGRVPYWLDRLLLKYRLQRTSISKYAMVVGRTASFEWA